MIRIKKISNQVNLRPKSCEPGSPLNLYLEIQNNC